jgi:hypothetical protein
MVFKLLINKRKNLLAKFDDISIINFSLSCLGIYLVNFFFGFNAYIYFPFYKTEVVIFGFLIIITIFFFNFFFFKLFKKLNYKFFKFYDCLLFSATIFYTYTFLIRYSDINYGIFLSSFFNLNVFKEIIIYSLPIILSGFTYYFFYHKKREINKFINILLIIFIVLSLIRLGKMPVYNINNSYLLLEKKTEIEKKIVKEKKIFFIIFDELDYGFLSKNLKYLPSINKLISKSFFHRNFYSPGSYTIHSIPSILLGTSYKKHYYKNGFINIVDQENKEIEFKSENTLIEDVKKKNMDAVIYGYHLAYCKIFKNITCYDQFYHKKRRINYKVSLKEFLHDLYLGYIINLDKIIPLKTDYKNFNNKIITDNEYLLKENIKFGILNPDAELMYLTTKKMINSEENFIYMHYPYPHPPLQIDVSDHYSQMNSYEKNFLLVEKTVEFITQDLEKNEESLLIITSDHWYKERNLNTEKNKKYPVFLLSKIIGDDSYHETSIANHGAVLRKFVNFFLEEKINNNYDIKNFFDNNIRKDKVSTVYYND